MMSPEKLFYDVKIDHQDLQSAKVFGYTTYILDPIIQYGKNIPRWSPCRNMGQFLGRSDEHDSSVCLIRNICTNEVSSHFQYIYDNIFSTVISDYNADNIPVPPEL